MDPNPPKDSEYDRLINRLLEDDDMTQEDLASSLEDLEILCAKLAKENEKLPKELNEKALEVKALEQRIQTLRDARAKATPKIQPPKSIVGEVETIKEELAQHLLRCREEDEQRYIKKMEDALTKVACGVEMELGERKYWMAKADPDVVKKLTQPAWDEAMGELETIAARIKGISLEEHRSGVDRFLERAREMERRSKLPEDDDMLLDE